MLVCNVVGARPNFMKMAPVVLELKRRGVEQRLIHTGQHYDPAMSKVFFDELGMPQPDLYLGVGSGSHAQQTAHVMMAIEEDCLRHKPSIVVVAGDVNSTVAGAMAASKLNIPVAHVEAGLRSFDRTMPEELNRIVTDHLSDLLFTTEESGNRNLRREGIDKRKIRFVGNCMVDSLRSHVQEAVRRQPWASLGVEDGGYALLTLHRPSNVDCQARLDDLLRLAARIAGRMPVLFPVHPRTREKIAKWNGHLPKSLFLLEPLPYLTFLGLMARCKLVLTDSGGIQEETTALGVPCLTLRTNTERPATVEQGTNEIVGENLERVDGMVDSIAGGGWKRGKCPPYWDGQAAHRIANCIEGYFDQPAREKVLKCLVPRWIQPLNPFRNRPARETARAAT
jgi:UDP-N-acetylglucosamine 2-epimerase (non-hydrolysing)